MKILQFINTMENGGAEAVVLNLHKLFLENNIESKIYVLDRKNNNFYKSPKETKFLNIKKHTLFKRNKLKKIINEENTDLILVHMCYLHKIFSKMEDINNLFFTIHLDLMYKYQNKKNLYKKFVYKKNIQNIYYNKNIITVSNNIKNNLIKLNIKPRILKTIYNPFNFEKINNLSNKKIEINDKYILNIGRFNKIKRHDILLQAFARIKNKNIKLVLIGEGETKRNIETLVKELNLEKKVILLGWQENPYKYIKNARLMVSSSESEALPNVIIESLILKTPVVATKTEGAKEILIDELNPFLSKINDYKDLANKINLALEKYPIIEEKYYLKFNDNIILKEYLKLIKGDL